MSTAVEKARPTVLKSPVGLMISIGAPKPERGPGRPIDHFRAKEGQLAQFKGAAAKFLEVYGDEPKELTDVYFLSNEIGAVLDIRLKAWGASGPKIVGFTNYAELPPEEFEQRAWAFDDDVLYFPLKASEVPKDRRDAWEGEPIRGKLTGPDDARIGKFQIGLEATLSICLPRVMGVGTVATLTTKGRNSTRNLYTSVRDQYAFFQGNLVGPPFRLTLRPKKSKYFDRENREYRVTTFYELVLDTALNISEIYEAIQERRVALGARPQGQLNAGPALTPDEAERRAMEAALQLPAPADEDVQTRDEPVVDRPSDAILNRIVQLEKKLGGEATRLVLRGVFGLQDDETAEALSQEDAERYEAILLQAVPAAERDAAGEEVETVVGEEVDEGEQFSFADKIPSDVKEQLDRS